LEVKIANETVQREIVLHNGEQHIMVKLWDDHSELPLHEGQRVVIHNVKTNLYKGLTSLNSTDERSVELPYILINTKNCSLSIVLTATDQKPQKSLKRS